MRVENDGGSRIIVAVIQTRRIKHAVVDAMQ